MLKILICCGGGFSSSAIATRMVTEVKKRNMENEVHIEFYPFSIAYEKYDQFDIVMCCPHLKIYINRLLKEAQPNIPIYILPPKMYGLMILDELIIDAKDVIELYKQGNSNPIHFPGEENPLRITRGIAYRNKK